MRPPSGLLKPFAHWGEILPPMRFLLEFYRKCSFMGMIFFLKSELLFRTLFCTILALPDLCAESAEVRFAASIKNKKIRNFDWFDTCPVVLGCSEPLLGMVFSRISSIIESCLNR